MASQVFNNTPTNNDLEGSLEAGVYFAQRHVIPAKPKQWDPQPNLIARCKTLLMVKPLTYTINGEQ